MEKWEEIWVGVQYDGEECQAINSFKNYYSVEV